MLKTRIISALLGVPVLAAIAWAGGYFWVTVIGLLSFIALYEIFRGAQVMGNKPLWIVGILVLVWGLSVSYLNPAILTASIVALLFLSVIMMVFLYPRYHIMDLAISWVYPIYIGVLMGYALRLAYVENHFIIILLTMFLTWASDTGGYFAGAWWGKNKLAPLLSPKKTREGFVGGFILTILIAAIGSLFLPQEQLYKFIILGIGAGVLAPVGDLFASLIKRDMEIKDYGSIIPGHGGVLDRFDSFILVAPMVYFFTLWLGR